MTTWNSNIETDVVNNVQFGEYHDPRGREFNSDMIGSEPIHYPNFNGEVDNRFGYGEPNEYPLGQNNFGDYGGFASDEEFEMNVEKVEINESVKSVGLLLSNDFKLFGEQMDLDQILLAKSKGNCNGEEDIRNLKYYSEGYDANVDAADDLEIARWHKHFPYLHVVGEGFEQPKSVETSERIAHEEEETFASHGTIEETPKLRVLPSVKQTVVDRDFRAVWNDVVDRLHPVIAASVQYANENGISRNIEDLIVLPTEETVVADNLKESEEKDDFWD